VVAVRQNTMSTMMIIAPATIVSSTAAMSAPTAPSATNMFI
jgi:hypothetical protein